MPPPTTSPFTCFEADLHHADHARAVADLVNMYAREPLARGSDLPREIIDKLPGFLRDFPTSHVFLAQTVGGDALDLASYAGIAVCVRSISTFTASPVMNIHDLAVRPEFRGRGVGRALMNEVERAARSLRCCKITLEVHRENVGAIAAYHACGFADGLATPAAGTIMFFEKKLQASTVG